MHCAGLQSTPPVHPLIVPLLDVGLEGTTPYVVMAFQPGETLDIVLRRAMPMSIDRALRILRPLAATLVSAGGAGILHGALHPRDVFVHDDEDGLAGVTGFGIVQALETAGMSNPLLRRPYVAPERGSGPWDARADVFSLGVIAHELLTGRRPARKWRAGWRLRKGNAARAPRAAAEGPVDRPHRVG